jgi:hypothetical protein
MTATIGWYVHHHGRGHLTRLLAIAAHVDAGIRCFSSLPEPAGLPANCTWTVLPRDDEPGDHGDPRDADPTVAGLLHWAPLDHTGHRTRLAAITAAVAADPVSAFVVDVSVEVALLVRLLGIRPVLIAQPGIRDDAPHRSAFQAATRIVAPWPQALLEPAHLQEVGDKVVYTGGISRFDGRPRTGASADGVLLLGGAGGSAVTGDDIRAAEAASGEPWRVLGGASDAAWEADPWEALTSASVVVSWAGQNAIADLAAAEAWAVVVPQERPFAEQAETAAALERAGLAIVARAWPEPAAWPDLLHRARERRPDWSAWQVQGAAERAAAAIMAVAEPAGAPR